MHLLELRDVRAAYGNLEALHGISLFVDEGEIVSLIGANGAGKTTTLRTICNLMSPTTGAVLFDGRDTRGAEVHELVGRGMVMVPENRGVFARMSVYENLLMGAYQRNDKDGVRADMDMVTGLFPRLGERMKQPAGLLSGGEQQMLAMGRALMTRPRLLLMDEPSMGLAPVLVDQIFEKVADISHQGTTILLVEQNARRALTLANRAYVMETGRLTLEGFAADLTNDPAVIEAYLGG